MREREREREREMNEREGQRGRGRYVGLWPSTAGKTFGGVVKIIIVLAYKNAFNRMICLN